MAHDQHRLNVKAFRPEDEVDDLFASANPNPERLGCPSAAALRELANKKRPIDDPLYAHLTKCSPCYRQFRALQSVASDRTRRILIPLAAVLLVGVTGVIWQWRQRPAPGSEIAKVEIDLRPFAAKRSDSGEAAAATIRLPRTQLTAEFVLPVGSETGPYEVRLLDQESTVTAYRLGGRTRVKADLDLRTVNAGRFQLGLRREGEDWRLYPVTIE
jgi:hypothetical protein